MPTMQPAEAKSRFITVRGTKLHYLEYGGAGLANVVRAWGCS